MNAFAQSGLLQTVQPLHAPPALLHSMHSTNVSTTMRLQGQQKAVDKLYKGMESWRHKVEAKKAKVDKLRAKHGAEASEPARAKKVEEATKALQISEGQLSGERARPAVYSAVQAVPAAGGCL